jgi:hypothetical protein
MAGVCKEMQGKARHLGKARKGTYSRQSKAGQGKPKHLGKARHAA